MSIASEITRLQGAKADIKTAIQNKGVTVPSNALLDDFDTYIAQISSGGVTGLVYETGTYTPSADIARPEISFTNQHTTSPIFIAFFDTTGTYDGTTYSNFTWTYVDSYKIWNNGYSPSSELTYYGLVCYVYRTSNSTSLTSTYKNFEYNSDNSKDDTTSCAKYYATNTSFKPYTLATTRYWRAGRTYKWIAVWK